jgi:hypothetical protein
MILVIFRFWAFIRKSLDKSGSGGRTSSPSISTSGFFTLIFGAMLAIVCNSQEIGVAKVDFVVFAMEL